MGTTGASAPGSAAQTLFGTVSGPLSGLFTLNNAAVFISTKTYANAGGALTGPAVAISLSDPNGMTLANAAAGTGSTVIASTLQSPNVTLFEAGGNLTVGDATMPSQLNTAIKLYTAGTVSVNGQFLPAADNTLALTIGDMTAANWTPKLIEVINDNTTQGSTVKPDGAIGTATLATVNGPVTNPLTFKSATLFSNGNILFGSTLFDQTLDTTTAPPSAINPIVPRPILPISTSHAVLLAVGDLAVSSDGRILQQNTSGFQATQTSGAYVTRSVTLSGYKTAGPQNVDLYLSIVNPSGGLLSGPTAALSHSITVTNGGNQAYRALYRVNSCVVGQQGNCTPTGDPVINIRIDDLLADVLPKQVDLLDVEDPTITGAANEEIWRKSE